MIGRETRIRELRLDHRESNLARCEELLLWIRGEWPIQGLRRLLNSHSDLKQMHTILVRYIAQLPRANDDSARWPFVENAKTLIETMPDY